MKLVVHCRTCSNEPFITWEKPELSEADCKEIISNSEHASYDCDIFVKLYDNDGTLLASIDEPIPEVVEAPRPARRWWEFWR